MNIEPFQPNDDLNLDPQVDDLPQPARNWADVEDEPMQEGKHEDPRSQQVLCNDEDYAGRFLHLQHLLGYEQGLPDGFYDDPQGRYAALQRILKSQLGQANAARAKLSAAAKPQETKTQPPKGRQANGSNGRESNKPKPARQQVGKPPRQARSAKRPAKTERAALPETPKVAAKACDDATKPKVEAKTPSRSETIVRKESEPGVLNGFPHKLDAFSDIQLVIWKKELTRIENSYRVSVSNGPADQLAAIQNLKLSSSSPTGTFNNHTLQAACRSALRVHALSWALKRGHTHLAEIYGSEASLTFIHHVNLELKAAGWGGKLQLDQVGEPRSAKDTNARKTFLATSQASFVLAVDVYDTNDVKKPDSFNRNITSMCPQAKNLYMIGMVMDGLAGSCPGYVWVAEGNKRLFSIGGSPAIKQSYPAWKDVDSHATDCAWYTDRTFTMSPSVAMSGIVFNLNQPFSTDAPEVVPRRYQYEKYAVWQSFFHRMYNSLSGSQPMILLDRTILDTGIAKFAVKSHSEFTYSSIFSYFSEKLNNPQWKALSDLLGYDNDQVAVHMTNLVLHTKHKQHLVSFPQHHAYANKYRAVNRNAMFTSEKIETGPIAWIRRHPLLSKIAASVGFGVVLLLLRKIIRNAVASMVQTTAVHVALISPLLEESVKHIPYIGKLVTAAIIGYETYRDRTTITTEQQVLRAAMHLVAGLLPWRWGLVLHTIWNIVCMLPQNVMIPGSLFQEYQDAMFSSPDAAGLASEVKQLDCPDHFVSSPPSLDVCAFKPAEQRTVHGRIYDVEDDQVLSRVVDNLTPCAPSEKIYLAAAFNGPSMWKSPVMKNSEFVALTLVYGRLATDLPGNSKAINQAWNCSDTMVMLSRCFDIKTTNIDYWYGEWKNHVQSTSKWKKYEQYWPERGQFTFSDSRVRRAVHKIQIMPKTDEVLLNKNEKKAIPRPIDNVHPLVAFITGPLDFMMKQSLFRHATVSDITTYQLVHHHNSTPFYWVPCLGFTQEDLTTLMNQFDNCISGFLLLSHGDDALLLRKDGMFYQAFEADLSSCDRSLTFPAMNFESQLFDMVLTKHRAPIEWKNANQIAFHLSGASRIVGDYTVDLDCDHQRPTGCTRTSLGNTILAAVPYIDMFFNHPSEFHSLFDPLTDSSALFLQYGMVVKAKLTDNYASRSHFPVCTFLKGIWLPSTIGLTWVRLPSMALKMFKSLKPLYQIVRKNKRDRMTLHEARTRYFHVVAQSYKPFVLPPGVHEWVDKWALDTPIFSRYQTEGRVSPGNLACSLNESEAIRLLSLHYNVDQDTYIDWIACISSLSPGSASIHPMWMALAADY